MAGLDAVLILTFVASNLAFIHDSNAFDCDLTFKRAKDFHEWEMVVFVPVLQRSTQFTTSSLLDVFS